MFHDKFFRHIIERREIDEQVMTVRQRQRDFRRVGRGGERRFAHGVERVLHRPALVRRERVEEGGADPFAPAVP